MSDLKFLVRRDTGRGIVLSDSRILLMERWRDGMHYFSIPGGGVEKGERPAETAQREIFEETNIAVRPGRLIYEMRDNGFTHYIYLCEYISGQPALRPDSEEARLQTSENRFMPSWQPVDMLASLPLTYWQPLRESLVRDTKHGFGDEPKIIEAHS